MEVADYYQKEAFRQCLDGTPYEFAYTSGQLEEDYLHDMKLTQAFASLNRKAIATEIVKAMKFQVLDSFEAVQNYYFSGQR